MNSFDQQQPTLTVVQDMCSKIKNEVKKVIVEQEELVECALIALLCDGHLLIEGFPGLGKTLFAKTFSDALDLKMNRIQFTPDLMPADVVGTKIYNIQNQVFELRKGPIHAQIILADEINRTPPKTQAGLLEAMEERAVTLDGETLSLPEPFLVLATQNPIEFEGTYILPEALVDRFLFKLTIGYPSLEAEAFLLKKIHHTHMQRLNSTNCAIQAVCSADEILKARAAVANVLVEENLFTYMMEIVQMTRKHHQVEIGSSPRGGIALLNGAKAVAAMAGRGYVLPEDVKLVAKYALNHRLRLMPEAELEGVKVLEVINEIVNTVKVPR